MGIFDKVKQKAEELLGRAEQVYGESHGDAAATVAGEAHVMEAEAEEFPPELPPNCPRPSNGDSLRTLHSINRAPEAP